MTTYWVLIACAVGSSLIHIIFFLMESVLWSKPKIMKIFGIAESDLKATKILAFNQGFYNLFLALMNIVAILFILTSTGTLNVVGFAVIASNSFVMLGAALVLLFSSPKMIRGVLLQGILPAVYLSLLFFG